MDQNESGISGKLAKTPLHQIRNVEVRGSIPLGSTIFPAGHVRKARKISGMTAS